MSKFAELPDGTKLEFPDDTADDIIDSTVKKHLGISAPKTTVGEDIGIGFKGLGHMGKDALDLLAGAAATHLGGDSDSIYADMEERNKAWTEEQQKQPQGFGGKVISGLTQLAPAVAAIPLVGPAPAMGALAGMSALSQGGRNVQAGADAMTQAVPQAIAEGALDMTAAKLIPGGKGMLQGMGYGAAGNLASTIGQDVIAPHLLPEKAQEFYKPDLEKYAVSAITGALPGAVIGHVGSKQADINNPYTRAPKTPEDTGLNVDADMRRQVDVLTTLERSLQDQIARQSDPASERTLELQNELYKARNARITLERELGNSEIPVAKTGDPIDVEAQTARQTAQDTVRVAEQEMNALQTEYRTIKSKGAATTAEDKARVAVIEQRMNELSDIAEANAAKAFGEDEPTDMSAMFAKQAESDRMAQEGATGGAIPPGDASVPPAPLRPTTTTVEAIPGLSEKASAFRNDLLEQLEYHKKIMAIRPDSNRSKLIEALEKQIASIESSAVRIHRQARTFVAGASVAEVHSNHNNIDIPGMSDAALAKAIEVKIAKLNKLGEGDFKDTVKSELDDFMAEREVRAAQAALDKASGTQLDAMLFNDYVPTTPFLSGTRSALESGGFRGALNFIANYGHTLGKGDYGRYFGVLAKAILRNKNLDNLEFEIDPNARYGASYNNSTGKITFKSAADITPSAILHETVHAIANRAIAAVQAGLAHTIPDFRVNAGARKLIDLYNNILKDPKAIAAIDKMVGVLARDAMLANAREFVAYGLSDNDLQNALRQIKSQGKPIWSKLKETLKDMFGDTSNARTALDDVLEYGEKLIELSDMKAPKHLLSGEDPIRAFRLGGTAEGLLHKIRNSGTMAFAHLFTAQIPQFLRNNPVASIWIDKIKDIQWRAETLKTKLSYGQRTPNSDKGGFFWKLKGPREDTAIVPSIQRIAKNEDIVDVHDALIRGYEKGVDADETIQKNAGGWTVDQTMLAKALAKGVTDLAEAAWRMYGRVGLPQDLKQRIGYMLTQRVGNYDVEISILGIPLRVQSFLTAGEANHWSNIYRKADSRITVTSKAKEKDSTQNLIEFIENLNTIPEGELRGYLSKQLMDLETQNSSIGNHTMRSGLLAGFVGDQAGLTKSQRGKLLRDGIPRAFNNYVDNIYSREIQKSYIDYHIDNGDKLDKTTSELLDFYTRSQIDRPYGSEQIRFQKSASDANAPLVREKINEFSASVREFFSNKQDQLFGYHMRDKHSIDRFLGMFSSVFYVANITMKPSIWLAQPLQSLMSVRSAFKEGESPRQVLMALGESTKMMALQKWGSDPEFLKALDMVSQEHNTLHPQMNNEFNSITVGHNPESILNKTIDMGLGRTISASGDKFSRLASFVFFYNLHKQSGLTGEALAKKAARDATDNMLAYGSKNLPAIYRELGIFGEQAAPLATFSHGQLGNMIVDVREFIQSPGARTTAPLILSMATMMLMGGAISLPILAEYELIRLAMIKMEWIRPDQWPSVSKMFNDYAPSWVSHGAISGATGVDIDASMRYTSLFKKLTDIEQQGMLSFFPHINWGLQAVSGAATLLKSTVSTTSKPAMDQALKDTLPKGPVYGTVDYLRNQDRGTTQMGKKGDALVQRGTKENVARILGGRSVLEAKDSAHTVHGMQMNQAQKTLEDSFAQHASEGNTEKAKKIANILMSEYYKGDSKQLSSLIEKKVYNANVPALLRMYVSPDGNQNEAQAGRFVRDNAGQYFQNRNR